MKMAKAALKTKNTEASVEDFIAALTDEQARKDCRDIVEMMSDVTKSPPRMWGSAIVGFGSITLKYPSGRELQWMRCGFSPRKANLTLYLPGSLEALAPQLAALGKHTPERTASTSSASATWT